MQMRAMGPGAGWRWMMQGINLGRNNPKAIFGGAALLLLVALVPTFVQLVAQLGLKMTSMTAMLGLAGFSLLFSLLVMPPVLGGYLRVIDASENGRATQSTAIFDTFKAGQGAPRMIALAIVMAVIAIAVFGAIFAIFGPGIFAWYMQVLSSQAAGAAASPATLPELPAGFGTVVGLSILFGLFFQGAYAVAFGQVALTERGVGGAMSDGFVGALKNLLPLLVLLVIWLVFALVLVLVVGLLVALLGVIGALIHPAMAVILAAPIYLAFILILYVVIFGVMYHVWHDVAGGESTTRNDGNIVAA